MKMKFLFMLAALSITAVFSFKTAHADYYTSNALLYEGMTSSNVTSLQKDLKNLGYFTGESTGYFGSYTKQSVIKYQKDNYLSPDGVVGHKTAKEIKTDHVLKVAKTYTGVPYVWGGITPSGFDCSGYTKYVLNNTGITIPRTAAEQYQKGTWVNKSNLVPGDLVFFSTYKQGPSHVGFYLGGNRFIHASSGYGYITTSELGNSYYAQHYIGAKRILG